MKKNRNKKLIVIASTTIIIAIIVYWVYQNNQNQKKLNLYEPVTVMVQDVNAGVSASGTIAAFKNVEVKSKASGQVLQLLVRDGEYVKKGQLLMILDPTEEQSKLNQCQANVKVAEGKLLQAEETYKEAKRNYQQQKALAQEKIVPQETYLSALSKLNIAKATVTICEADLITTKEQLKTEQIKFNDTKIIAPMDGIVLQKLIEEGQIISSGISSNTGGTSLFIIGNVNRLLVDADVDEVDISKLQVGQKVLITVDAYPGKNFHGKLTHITPQAQNVSEVTIFDIEVEIIDSDKHLLKPGMTASVEIIYNHKTNTLVIPITALITKRNKTFVYVKKFNQFELKKIETGIESEDFIEVTKGLKDGQTIYVLNEGIKENKNRSSGHRPGMPF